MLQDIVMIQLDFSLFATIIYLLAVLLLASRIIVKNTSTFFGNNLWATPVGTHFLFIYMCSHKLLQQ